MIIPLNDVESFEFPLATKRGTPIPNLQKPEHSPEKARTLIDFHDRNFQHLQRRSISATYNCIGMVFASRRTFVDTKHVKVLLAEDGYRKIAEFEARRGDVIVYRNTVNNEVVHVGVLITEIPDEAEWLILSKWGPGGEYFHKKRQTYPLYLENVEFEYWTERIEL